MCYVVWLELSGRLARRKSSSMLGTIHILSLIDPKVKGEKRMISFLFVALRISFNAALPCHLASVKGTSSADYLS